MSMNKIQLRFDLFQPQSLKKQNNKSIVNCQRCNLLIDLSLQEVRQIKARPHCGDRTWLLSLKSTQAAILYGIDHATLGKRLKDCDK